MTAELLKVLTEATSFAVLVGIIWYVFGRGIPQFIVHLENQHREARSEVKEQRKEFLTELDRQRKEFSEMLNDQRHHHEQSMRGVAERSENAIAKVESGLGKVVDAIDELRDRIEQNFLPRV